MKKYFIICCLLCSGIMTAQTTPSLQNEISFLTGDRFMITYGNELTPSGALFGPNTSSLITEIRQIDENMVLFVVQCGNHSFKYYVTKNDALFLYGTYSQGRLILSSFSFALDKTYKKSLEAVYILDKIENNQVHFILESNILQYKL